MLCVVNVQGGGSAFLDCGVFEIFGREWGLTSCCVVRDIDGFFFEMCSCVRWIVVSYVFF